MKNRLLQIYCGLLVLIFFFPPVKDYAGDIDGFEFILSTNQEIIFPLMLIEILIVTLIFGAIYLNKK